ncbi:4Fe-4S single cluster domain-containing protein [Desulfovibrio cuneatus]|uniref:4Fe-4S single cluster domain-containing protein n=1 Tax=Desulfovibrio cuneatus TaxID=159728 RepID=UPI0003FF3703|nr:4Fe-4S single cluster domain-containing protein [Desulfovibrio cuneatus]
MQRNASLPCVHSLRVHGVVEESIVDGPGLRFVVFTQGCLHGCPGCHNPATHSFGEGYETTPQALLTQFATNPLLAGVTFSGGEPFLQPEPLAFLAKQVHALGKTVVVYTGYTLEALYPLAQERPAVASLLEQTDLLIDGPYVAALRELDSGLKGSSNQRILDNEAIGSLWNVLQLRQGNVPNG